jgi:hypothetical protein
MIVPLWQLGVAGSPGSVPAPRGGRHVAPKNQIQKFYLAVDQNHRGKDVDQMI